MRRPLACASVILSGLCLTASSGCYHMYSQPYGYSGAPQGAVYPGSMPYQAPIQTLTPGQPYVPGGSYQSVPQGATTPTYQGGGLQPIPESSNSAPNYNNSTAPSTNTSPTTPDPYFPNTYNAPKSGLNSIPATAYNEPAPLNPPTAGLREVRSLPTEYVPDTNLTSAPLMKGDIAAPAPASAVIPASASAPPVMETFAPPVMSAPPGKGTTPVASAPALQAVPAVAPAHLPPLEATPAAAQSLWDVETKKVVTADESPFGHDSKFQWLRGVVSKEPQDNTWSIVYSDEPDTKDKWAGHLSLAPSPHLDNLHDGDVVEIQGQIDDVVQDQLGKPVYVISSLKKPFEAKK